MTESMQLKFEFELELLSELVDEYEEENCPIESPSLYSNGVM